MAANHQPSPWTDERVALLKEYWETQHSCAIRRRSADLVDLFADALPPPEFLGVPWIEAVDSKGCMYPEGDGPNMLFCGQPRKDESSYCPGHSAICWIRLTGKRTVKWKLWGAAA